MKLTGRTTDRVLSPLLVAALLVFLQLRSGAADSYLLVVTAMAAFAYVLSAGGRLLLAAIGAPESDPSAAYACGLLVTCLAVYALTVALPVTAGMAFGAVAAAVIALDLGVSRRRPAPPDWRALLGFALCVALTAAWCSAPAGAYETVRTQGVLPVWSDYFFHGGVISQFGDPRALGRGSIYLADHPSSFYHFASYAGAAALAGMLQQPGLPLAVAAWLPLGFLSMLAGAYVLGARLSGAAGGIAAVAALALAPDASNYGLRNGLFSFHWTLMAHPGATYALGAAFLSLALLDRWSTERVRATLIASGLLALSILLFRAHIFLLYLPAWLATVAVCTVRDSGRRRRAAWLMIAGLGAGAIMASLVLAHLAGSDSAFWRFGAVALPDFLAIVHTAQEPTAYDRVYRDLVITSPPALALTAGIALAIVAALGAWLILLPASALLAAKARALKPVDSCCGYLFFCWLLLMLFAPRPWHGEVTDLIHRPFVLLYAACAIWTVCLLLRVLATRAAPARRLWPALLAAALLALPAIVAGGAEKMARPKFRWGEFDAAAPVPSGLVEAAAFLRRQAAVGDIFAAAGLSAGNATFDLSTQLCALSGMPAYLSRPHFEMIKEAPRKAVAAARLAALAEVDRLTDYAQAMQSLQRLRVQWYVVAGEKGPRWDPQRRRAAFSAGNVALYAARTESSGGTFHDEVGVRDADQVVAHKAAHRVEIAARKPLVSAALAHVLAAVE